MMALMVDSYICPGCGSEVRVGGVCQVCPPKKKGKKKKKRAPKKSWEVDDAYDGLGLPDEDFDYDEFVEREFGNKPHRKVGISIHWWLTAIVMIVVLTWLIWRGW